MSRQNPTIIVGHLDDSELTKSIDKLVNEVANKTTIMAGKFTSAIGKMQDAMKDFAITQKVSVDLMKEAWRDMSKSFDAMVAAQSGATGGSKGSGKGKVYAPDTVGALEQEIALEKEKRREMQLGSDVLRDQNKLLELRAQRLKRETTSDKTLTQKLFASKYKDISSMSDSSLPKAIKKLQELKTLQDEMRKNVFIDKAQFNRVEKSIDVLTEKIARLKKKFGSQGTQPNTLQDVLGMDENSFDAISKKMSALKKLSWSDPIEQKRITDEYQRLRQEQNKLMASNAQMARSNNYLAQSFGYIRNRIVYALTLGAITNFVKQIYEVRGQYELLERSLGVLVNSFERGSQVFNELNQMAIESPFTLMDLAGAAKQLTAYNFAANEVVNTTRRLADISAALGVPMERLTYNLGQIRAQTVLNARDARDFANAGLPIVKSLSDYYTELEGKIVSTGDVYDRMSKKMVSYNDVMAVLNKMTDEGGKFFEFQAKQAQTLRVQMANLTLAWNNMLNEMGKSNQGLLSLPIQGLKAMLQNWASLNRVLKNVVLSFGLLRVMQMIAIRHNWQLAASAGGAAKMMGFLGNAANKLGASLGALMTNRWTWISVGIFAFVDLIGQMRAAKQATAELNEEIRNGATEASQANLDFLGNKGNKATLELAKQNKLTAEQGEKAWQAIEQQISTSAMSANKLLGELWAIDDINERVRKGFEYTESIQKAQAALQDLKDDTIKVDQDNGWFGIFDYGLVSNLEAAQDALSNFKGTANDLERSLKDSTSNNTDYGISIKGLRKDIKETSESINNFIVANNITDPLQINEILERARAIIKTKNPKIKGDLATLFDVELDTKMSELTNGVVDKNASLWNVFLERLKSHYHHAFEDITDEWVKTGKGISEAQEKEQQKAVDANLEYFKKTMPLYYNAIESMVSDASKLRINIGVTFGVQKLTDFQDQVNKRIAKAPKTLDFGTKAMLPTQNDDLSSWVKTQQEAIAKLTEENKKYQRDNTTWSKERIKANNTEIGQRKNLLDLFNQAYENEKGRGGSKKDPMLDTLKQTIEIVKKLQSEYDTLTKSGASSADALDDVRKRYSRTINLLNKDLAKFGLPQLNLDMIKGRNPNDVLEYFQKISDILTNKGLSTLERQKAVEVVIQEFSLKAKTYNLDMITKGLNNELGKLKDEYELAVAIDADPELGMALADMMGINVESLPHTVKEYADQYSKYLNKFLKGKDSALQLSGDELFSLTRDDIDAFREQVEAGTFNQEWFNEILKAYENISGKRKKDLEDTEKWKNGLIEKYGDLQDKLTKIYKDSVQNQVNAVKTFSKDEGQKSEIVSLQLRLEETDNPAELAEINTRIAEIVKDVTDKNPIALKLVNASANQTKVDTSKAYWEDFKNSELYAMTFEDTANLSNRAIDTMIDKLEELKDKVKESPNDMKALINAKNELEKVKNERDPFGGVARSLRNMAAASRETKVAQEALWRAEVDVEDAQREVDNTKNGTPKEQAAAQKKLADALKRRAAAHVNLTQAENKEEKAQKDLKTSLQGISNKLGDVQELFGVVSKLFRAGGDDETADAIDAISEGFSVMTTVIMGVVAVMNVLKNSNPWLLAIATALSVIVGLASFLSNQSNEKINKQIKNSERQVKSLENAYKDLEKEIENAYGTNVVGAKQAAIENKKLQLVELERQLMLEKRRSGKNRDEDKIIELEGKVIDLRNEIEKSSKEIVNDLLGISSVKDKAMELMDAYISALRKGEDAQKAFSDSYKEMIVDMLKQIWVTKVIGPQLEALVNDMNERIKKRIEKPASELERAKNETTRLSNLSDAEVRAQLAQQKYRKEIQEAYDAYRAAINEWDYNFDDREGHNKVTELGNKYQEMIQGIGLITQEEVDSYRQTAKENEKKAQEALDKASTPTIEDLDLVAQEGLDLLPRLESMGDTFTSMLDRYGLYDKESNLSALQQGLQSMSEDTGSALESYMNGVSQQVYYHSTLLEQIRDSVVGLDLDVSLGVQSQMLLQLQNSYQTQQAIQQILEGVLVPSGRAFAVELMS